MANPPSKLVLFLDDGPLAHEAFNRFAAVLKKLNMPWQAECHPLETDSTRLKSARFVVGFAPLADGPDCCEVWPADLNRLDDEINDLIARLFTGSRRIERPKVVPMIVSNAPTQPKAGKAHTIKIGRETKGRRGKGVTLLSELPPDMTEAQRAELTTFLKSRCGTGGTLRDDVIEIQGDQRDRVAVELEKLGYKVKRAGG